MWFYKGFFRVLSGLLGASLKGCLRNRIRNRFRGYFSRALYVFLQVPTGLDKMAFNGVLLQGFQKDLTGSHLTACQTFWTLAPAHKPLSQNVTTCVDGACLLGFSAGRHGLWTSPDVRG